MPRIRSIKPDFWNDEKLGQEPESIMLTFIGLWNFADDYGVVKANHLWLKNQIYPYKDKLRIDVFSTWLQRLSELEAIILFTYRSENFYCIRTFRKHQRVEKPSKARNCPEEYLIPALDEIGFVLNDSQEFIKSGSSRGVVGEPSPLEGEGEKDIGKGYRNEPPDGGGGADAPLGLSDYKKVGKDKKMIYEFIRINNPQFIEPYVDFWNLFAAEKRFAQVQKVNDQRYRKFKIRVREKTFNFPEILRKAGQSEFILKGKWFAFDWIIENDSNYLKVLEGNFDKKGEAVVINTGPTTREIEEAENRIKLGM
jgi:hypothetical protein